MFACKCSGDQPKPKAEVRLLVFYSSLPDIVINIVVCALYDVHKPGCNNGRHCKSSGENSMGSKRLDFKEWICYIVEIAVLLNILCSVIDLFSEVSSF